VHAHKPFLGVRRKLLGNYQNCGKNSFSWYTWMLKLRSGHTLTPHWLLHLDVEAEICPYPDSPLAAGYKAEEELF